MYDWVCSDQHWNHRNIVQFCNRPENHNELMVANWKDRVGPEDTVLLLGDVLFGPQLIWDSMPGKLPGRVTVVQGNHDHEHKIKFMENSWGWKVVDKVTFTYRGWLVIFSHFPIGAELKKNAVDNTDMELIYPLAPRMLNVHGHMHDRPALSPQHINVCVEWMEYSPQPLEALLDAKIDELET